MEMALVFAVVHELHSYFFSDKIALAIIVRSRSRVSSYLACTPSWSA